MTWRPLPVAAVLLCLASFTGTGCSGGVGLSGPCGDGMVQTEEAQFQNRWGVYKATIWHRGELNSNNPNPMIVFAHGFGAEKEMYTWIGRELAREGYLTLLFTVPRRLSPRVTQWVDGLRSAITYLETESPFRTLVDPSRVGIMGHSMGGLAALIAATLDDRVTVVVAFAPAVGKVLSIFTLQQPNLSEIHVPVQLQIGSEDELIPVENVRRAYEEITAEDKSLVVIQGGTHVQFADVSLPLGFNRQATMSIDEFHQECREAFLPFLNRVLKPNASSTVRTTAVRTVTTTQTLLRTVEIPSSSLCLVATLVLLIPALGVVAWAILRRTAKTQPSRIRADNRG